MISVSFFCVKPSSDKMVILLDFRIITLTDDMIKYKPDFKDITTKTVSEFARKFLDKKLKVTFYCQILNGF